jgi:hypothetical protein
MDLAIPIGLHAIGYSSFLVSDFAMLTDNIYQGLGITFVLQVHVEEFISCA